MYAGVTEATGTIQSVDRTTLATTAVDDSVHFEADILAKYVDRQRTLASGGSERRDDSDRGDGVRA